MSAAEWVRKQVGSDPHVVLAAPVPGLDARGGCGNRKCTAVLYYPIASAMAKDGEHALGTLDAALADGRIHRVVLAADHVGAEFKQQVQRFKRIYESEGKELKAFLGELPLLNEVTNDYANGAPQALNNRGDASFAAGLLAHLGKSLGEGSFGAVHDMAVTPEVLQDMRMFVNRASYRVLQELPREAEVIVKVAPFARWRERMSEEYMGMRNAAPTTRTEFIKDCVREATVHRRLSNGRMSACVPMGCWNLCPSQVVPRFYFAGLTRDASGDEVYVTCMQKVQGKMVSSMGKKNLETVKVYAAVERAAAALWSAGVLHGDFHFGNLLYHFDARTQSVYVHIIDFGFSVIIPAELRNRVRARMGELIDTPDSMATVWLPREQGGLGLMQYLRTALWRRKRQDEVNDDGSILLLMHNRLGARTDRLAAMRKQTCARPTG